MTLETLVAAVSDFVTRTRGKPKRPITADTKLFQEGVIDSFALFELQADLDKWAGKPLPEGELMPDDFESPRVLFARLEELLK